MEETYEKKERLVYKNGEGRSVPYLLVKKEIGAPLTRTEIEAGITQAQAQIEAAQQDLALWQARLAKCDELKVFE